MRIATFNLQNLRLRGDGASARLDGARDRGDTAPDTAPDRADRRLSAALLAQVDADIVALQEVFRQKTLDHFHDHWLVPAGARPWPTRVCLPGNDGHAHEVALLSRPAPVSVTSHAGVRPADLGLAVPAGLDPDRPVFRRDCVEVSYGSVTLLLCHFKAPFPDAAAAWPVRHLEARAVRRLLEARFADPAAADWIILGDLNAHGRDPADSAIAPILAPFSVDLGARAAPQDRWSYFERAQRRYSRPDRILAAPALAARFAGAVPRVARSGLALSTGAPGPHLFGLGRDRPHASDHAAVHVDLPGLLDQGAGRSSRITITPA